MSAEKDQSLQDKYSFELDTKLAAYFASAIGIGSAMARGTNAAIVANTTPQAITINGEVDIDFDGDGIAEFQIDHDRYNLNGNNLDYLQIDKNDKNGAANPFPIDGNAVFSSSSGVYAPPFVDDYDGNHHGSWDSGDLAAWTSQYGASPDPNSDSNPDGDESGVVDGRDFLIWQRATVVTFSYDQGYRATQNGEYPMALTAGTLIDPAEFYDFSETSNNGGYYTRANRLLDEDEGQIDNDSGRPNAPPANSPGWEGLGGATRYLGVRFDLHDEGYANNLALVNGPDVTDDPNNYWYGWIGVEITNEADATGNVTGWAYETERGVGINAGDVGSLSGLGAVPEPSSLVIGAIGGAALLTRFGWQRILKDKK